MGTATSTATNRPVADRVLAIRVGRALVWGASWLVPLAYGAESSAAPTFTNVTAAMGLTHVQSATSGNEDTGGVAVGDFDGDGLVDLFFTRVDAADVLYRNTGSGFQNVSAAAGFTQVLPTNGVASGDIDNDGDLDLYLTASSHERFYLYVNDGAGHFTEQAIARGADVAGGNGTTRRGMGVAFGDYDRDGYLDILTTDYARTMANNGSRLLRNLGAANPGHFEDVTHAAGLDVYRSSLVDTDRVYRFQPRFADVDRDGNTDILFTGDHLTSQLFWSNGDGTFADGTLPAGLGSGKSDMGSALADYDADGDLDWFITDIFDGFVSPSAGNRFYRNNGNRKFTDVTTATGTRASGSGTELSWGWGTSFLDYDNDADQDLAMTNGWPYLGYSGDHTTLRRKNGDGTFTDVSAASGITDTGQGRGLVRLDYDADGDLDFLIVNYGAAPILYRNNGEDIGHWLRVKTEGMASNRDGIGAWITVVPDDQAPTQFQAWEVSSGGSYLSQEEMTAHFGLGSLTGAVDQVTIEWPSGLVQTYVDVPVDSLLRAQERLLGDFNGDGQVDAADYSVWRDSLGLTGVDLAADTAGATGLPDGVVDQLDYAYWRANFGRSFLIGGGSAAGGSSVPEPYGIELLIAGSLLTCVAMLRRHRGLLPTAPATRRRRNSAGCQDSTLSDAMAVSGFRRAATERYWAGRWVDPTVGLLVTAVLSCGATCVCLPASAAPTFTNVTAATGITHSHTAAGSLAYMSAGAAAADFDGDGLVDLFFTQLNSPAVLYRNTGSGFVDMSAAAGFTQVLPMSGVASGDIDNDGDQDLMVMGTNSPRHYLYINDGAGHFTEDAIARNADVSMNGTPGTRFGQGVAFGDYDGDGYLDMMTTDYSKPTASNGSRLLRNLGAANPGHFEDVTHAAGLDVYRQGLHYSDVVYRFQPRFSDVDRDGHVDILLVSDERTSQLFWNNGDGTFTDGTVAAGVGTDKSGMGSALGDYDGDGDLDWFITAIYDGFSSSGNRLYRNNGNRTFTDVTTAASVRNSGTASEKSWGWGTAFLDYDNDADLDLMSTNGCFTSCNGTNDYLFDHTSLRRNNGDGTFTDVSSASGITDTGQGRGLVTLDYDSDGDLDALVVNYEAVPILYRNDGGNESNWLRVKTEGTISNRDGIGAFITVTPDLDHPEKVQVWEVSSGDSYLSQSELTAHFGLGDFAGAVDLVEVFWPASGLRQRYVDVPSNATLLARERLLGDFNGDLVVDAADYTMWRDELGMSGAGMAADVAGPNGLPDGIVDQLDFRCWQANFGLSLPVVPGFAAAASAPEPGCLSLLTVTVGATTCLRDWRRRPRAFFQRARGGDA